MYDMVGTPGGCKIKFPFGNVMFLREKKLWFILHFRTLETFIVGGSPMLKTVKNGSGIRVDPPLFFSSKFPHFPVVFFANVPNSNIFMHIL